MGGKRRPFFFFSFRFLTRSSRGECAVVIVDGVQLHRIALGVVFVCDCTCMCRCMYVLVMFVVINIMRTYNCMK